MMPRKRNYRDEYRSTGWCKILGGPRAGGGNAAAGAATRAANAAARSDRMDAIIDRYVVKQFSLRERGQ